MTINRRNHYNTELTIDRTGTGIGSGIDPPDSIKDLRHRFQSVFESESLRTMKRPEIDI